MPSQLRTRSPLSSGPRERIAEGRGLVLREQSRTKAMFLIIYNQTRQEIIYDRAIFFFNKQSVLTDFAYSRESAPVSK